MSERLNEIAEMFQGVDPEMRLELLLDYANRLPALPGHLREVADREDHQVHECQTPVFLWVEGDEQKVDIHVEVAEEAPTVKGFASILVHAFSGEPREVVLAMPADLLNRLGLSNLIRMNRTVGLTALLGRIRKEAETLNGATA